MSKRQPFGSMNDIEQWLVDRMEADGVTLVELGSILAEFNDLSSGLNIAEGGVLWMMKGLTHRRLYGATLTEVQG